jgi:DNA modification methylase
VTPYYEHAGITIYHGDCRDVMDEWEGLRTQGFDLLLTDPPYGHGEKWSGGTWASDPMYQDAKRWDAVLFPSGDLVRLIAFARKSVVWGGNYYPLPPTRSWLAWEKASKMSTMADFELAWTNLDRPAKLFREQRNPDGKRSHPTQKPESLMRWCLSFVGGSVFDPFMGSGVVLSECKRAGRQCVGIDREERYCEMAAKRLSQEVLPLEAIA